MDEQRPLVVIGLGQGLRGDDAAGLEVVRCWQQRHPETAAHHRLRVELSPLPGLHLLELLQGARAAILVDALDAGKAPGSILKLDQDDIAAFSGGAASAHGWGVGETLALAHELGLDDLPEISVLAIQAGNVDMGLGLSDAVAAAIPQAVERLQARVLGYLRELRAESSESIFPLTAA